MNRFWHNVGFVTAIVVFAVMGSSAVVATVFDLLFLAPS
jgi:hypothetical protein